MKGWKIFLIIIIVVSLMIGAGAFVKKDTISNVGSNMGGVLNFGQNSMSGLANSSWPMYAHDRQHTGMAPVKGPQTNNTKWTFEIGSNQTGGWMAGAPIIGSDGTIYQYASPAVMTDNLYFLYAVSPNGTLKWKTNERYGGYTGYGGSLIDSNGTIYIPDSRESLYAFDSNNGTLKWTFKGEEASGENSAPNIAQDGTIYMISGKFFYAINPDGSLKWKMKPNETFPNYRSNPAVGPDGTIYFVGITGWAETADWHLYAMDPNGKIKWDRNFMMCLSSGSPAVGKDGTAYLIVNMISQSGTQYIYAFDQNGNEKWKSPTSPASASMSGGGIPGMSSAPFAERTESVFQSLAPALGPDGTIYVPTRPYLLALQSNGTQKWNYEFLNDEIMSPIAVDNEGTVYVSTSYNNYAISSNGTVKWKYKINPAGKGNPILGPDGTLYITHPENRFIYAIGP